MMTQDEATEFVNSLRRTLTDLQVAANAAAIHAR